MIFYSILNLFLKRPEITSASYLAQSHFKNLQLETLNNLYIKLFLAPNLCFVPVKILASGSNFLILHTSN